MTGVWFGEKQPCGERQKQRWLQADIYQDETRRVWALSRKVSTAKLDDFKTHLLLEFLLLCVCESGVWSAMGQHSADRLADVQRICKSLSKATLQSTTEQHETCCLLVGHVGHVLRIARWPLEHSYWVSGAYVVAQASTLHVWATTHFHPDRPHLKRWRFHDHGDGQSHQLAVASETLGALGGAGGKQPKHFVVLEVQRRGPWKTALLGKGAIILRLQSLVEGGPLFQSSNHGGRPWQDAVVVEDKYVGVCCGRGARSKFGFCSVQVWSSFFFFFRRQGVKTRKVGENTPSVSLVICFVLRGSRTARTLRSMRFGRSVFFHVPHTHRLAHNSMGFARLWTNTSGI